MSMPDAPRPRLRRADRRGLSRRRAWLASARRRQPSGASFARGGVWRGCPARRTRAASHLVRRFRGAVAELGHERVDGAALATRSALRARARDCGCAAVRVRSRQHAFLVRASTPERIGRPAGRLPACERPDDESRRALGGLPVPHRRAGAGGGTRHRRSSPSFSIGPCCSTGLPRASACEASQRISMPPPRYASSGPGRICALDRGPLDAGRRAGGEPPGRRVLRLSDRGLGRGGDLVRRLPSRLPGPRGDGDPSAVRGRPDRRCVGRLERGLPDRDCSISTTARGGWVSSASGATPASPAT